MGQTSTPVERVLIVEDDVISLEIISQLLTNCGYLYETATDGEQALEKILAKPADYYSVILSDIEMPKMSGMDLLKKVKAIPAFADIPFVLETSHTQTDVIRECIQNGAYYYLTKPLVANLVCEILHAAIEDRNNQNSITSELDKYRTGISLLESGRFRLKTPAEAKILAATLCHLSKEPVKTSMGIYELVQNAIEHGNLGINYQEKGRLIKQRKLLREINQRLQSPLYQERYVTVEFKVKNHDKILVISDMGEGFDFEEYLECKPERLFDEHGRGITLSMLSGFQQIVYSNQGKTVTCLLH